MAEKLDWALALSEDVPASLVPLQRFVHESDLVFAASARQGTEASRERLANIGEELSIELLRRCYSFVLARGAVLQREFALELKARSKSDLCFRMLQDIVALGFRSPVEKARVVLLLLEYLESSGARNEVQRIVEQTIHELETFRIGCDENISALRTFTATGE